MRKAFFVILTAIALCPLAVLGQDSLNVANVGRLYFWHYAHDVDYQGNYAYVADGCAGLRIVNVAVPANPVEVSYINDIGNVTKIVIAGNYAYLLTNCSSNEYLTIANISDPENPVLTGQLILEHSPLTLAVQGNHVYIGYSFFASIVIADVSNPANPVISGEYASIWNLKCLKIEQGRLYAATWSNGIYVFDLANPNHLDLLYQHPVRGYATIFDVQGNYIYYANSHNLSIVDISAPNNPHIVGSVSTLDNGGEIEVNGNIAVLASECGLELYDVTDPSNPFRTDAVSMNFWGTGVAVNGNSVYLSNECDGLKILDISDPGNIIETASYNIYGSPDELLVQDDILYTSCGNAGLKIYDISQPENPVELSRTYFGFQMKYMTIQGNYIYTNCDYGNNRHGLAVIDISDPVNPVLVNSIGHCQVKCLLAEGNFLYVSSYQWGDLVILDITDPVHPLPLGVCYIQNGYCFYGMDCQDGFIYGADSWDFFIVDVRNPQHPELVYENTLFYLDEYDVVTDENYAYIAYGYGTFLKIRDISRPSNPIEVANLNGQERAAYISKTGNLLYTSGGDINIVDVSNPFQPEIVGYYRTDLIQRQHAVNGNYLYVAESLFGSATSLAIYRIDLDNGTESARECAAVQETDKTYLRTVSVNGNLNIEFTLPQAGNVEVKLYNILGQKIASIGNRYYSVGAHQEQWNMEGLPSGIYFVHLKAGNFNQTQKLVLLK